MTNHKMSFEECIHEIKKNNIEYIKNYISSRGNINAKSTQDPKYYFALRV